MTQGPLSIPGAKATLLLSVLMTMMGTSGMVMGYVQLGLDARQVEAAPGEAPLPEELRAEAQAIQDEIRASTVPQAVGAGNIVVSLLLVIASFLLTARHASALWWTSQALIANVFYAVGAGAAQVWQIQQWGARLTALFVATADEGGQFTPEQVQSLEALPTFGSCLAVVVPLLTCIVYGVLWRISRRPTVRAFVLREND